MKSGKAAACVRRLSAASSHEPLTARGESLASHRDGRGATPARRDDREYPEYLSEEQRSRRRGPQRGSRVGGGAGMHRPSTAARFSPRALRPQISNANFSMVTGRPASHPFAECRYVSRIHNCLISVGRHFQGRRATRIRPILSELIRHAANGEVVHNDDTSIDHITCSITGRR